MNDIKLSNVNLGGVANAADSAKSAASAPPPSSDAQKGEDANSSNATKDVATVQSIVEAKADQSGKQQQEKEVHLKEAVTKLNDYIQSVQRNLEFNVDDDSGRTVVKVVDRNTNEVVRQIPNEQALEMAQNLQQDEPLSLFTMKV